MSARAQNLLAARVSRAESVARELQREISEGRERGEHLGTKDELRDQFGVAVATMNEAIRLLETRGIVVTRPGPGGGVFVAGDAARMAFSHMVLGFTSGGTPYVECLEIRDALELLICRHAARNHRAQDIRALNKILDQMAADTADPSVYFEANWALHRKIATLCDNTLLRTFYLSLLDVLEGSIQQAKIGKFDGKGFLRVHRDLVAAIDKGEGPQLDAAVDRHRPTQSLIADLPRRVRS